MKISFETIAGIVAGFGLFFAAIVLNTDNYFMFLSLSSLALVIGGTFAATMISFQSRYVFRSLMDMMRILIPSSISANSLFNNIGMIIRWSRLVRSDGISALEKKIDIDNIEDPFLRYGLQLLITGYKVEEFHKMLENFMETSYERKMVQVNILQVMGSIAPAFGMIGTLVGLVIMLDKMGGDPEKLGAGLAVALLTTLYGVLFAQLVFIPAARKIEEKENMLRFRNSLILQGFVLLASSKSPMFIQDSLNSFLDPNFHFSIAKKGE